MGKTNVETIISLDNYLAMCRQIVDERPVYRSGGSGADGTCDCIGLIIGAIRRAGGVWTGMHGSNYAARYEMRTLNKVRSVMDLSKGMAIYKARELGHKKYALPSGYKNHSDQKDYYHVGVVDSVEPLRIVHVTSSGSVSGPMVDTMLGVADGAWAYAGMLDKVDYGAIHNDGGGFVATQTATVVIPAGVEKRYVHFRKTPSELADRVTNPDKINEGAIVTVCENKNGWAQVDFCGVRGYVMAKFLQLDGSTSVDNDQQGYVTWEAFNALADRVSAIEGGRG